MTAEHFVRGLRPDEPITNDGRAFAGWIMSDLPPWDLVRQEMLRVGITDPVEHEYARRTLEWLAEISRDDRGRLFRRAQRAHGETPARYD